MRKLFNSLVLLISIYLLITSCSTAVKNPFEGSWIGVAETKPFPELLFMYSDTAIMAKMYYREIELQEATSYEYNENKLRFSFDHENFQGYFEGDLVQDTIKGNLFENGESVPCHFIRIEPEGPEKVSEYAGFYKVNDDHILKIEPFPLDFTLTPLLVTDYKTGKKRVAFPMGDNMYLSGERQLSPYPTDIQLKLEENNTEPPSITLTENNQSKKAIRLKDLDKKIAISVNNRGASIHADLNLPEQEGPYSLVVVVHGAGNQTRESFTLADFSTLLPYYGIATLVYDKRGFGESEGDAQNSDFTILSEDILELIKEASLHKEIDANSIGLLGVDQACFLMPIIAQKNENIRFIAGVSTPVTSMQEQELQACVMRMQADGFPEKDIAEALEYQKTMFTYLEGKTDSLTFQKKSDNLPEKSWKNYVTSFDKKEWISWWRKNHHYQVKVPLEKTSLPMYFIYGGQDPLIKASQQIEILNQSISSELLQKKVYPNANHFMYEAGNRGDFQLTEIKGYPENMFYDLHKWMASQLGIIKE